MGTLSVNCWGKIGLLVVKSKAFPIKLLLWQFLAFFAASFEFVSTCRCTHLGWCSLVPRTAVIVKGRILTWLWCQLLWPFPCDPSSLAPWQCSHHNSLSVFVATSTGKKGKKGDEASVNDPCQYFSALQKMVNLRNCRKWRGFSAYFPTAFDSKCIDGCSLFGMEVFLLLAYGQQHPKNDRLKDQPRGLNRKVLLGSETVIFRPLRICLPHGNYPEGWLSRTWYYVLAGKDVYHLHGPLQPRNHRPEIYGFPQWCGFA